MRVRLRVNHWLPKWLEIGAITLYPYLLFSDKQLPMELIQHEFVHVRQLRELGWFKFYASYLFEYAKAWWKLRDRNLAYHAIPYEEEAYDQQHISQFSESEKQELLKEGVKV